MLLRRRHDLGVSRSVQRVRDLLAEELGVDPSAETTALYLDVLRAGS